MYGRRDVEVTAERSEMGDVLQIVSHDLKQPLRAVQCFAQIVHDRHADGIDERGRHYLVRVVEGAQRMTSLLDDLARFAAVAIGEGPFQELPLSSLVRGALRGLGVTGDQLASVCVDDDLPVAFVAPASLRHAVEALLQNALQFVGPDGRPEVEVVAYRPRRGEPAHFGLEVHDRGPGVAPEQRELIFDLFRRFSATRVGGAGIGLAIVRQVATQHGGAAWVREREGGGSEFVLTLGSVR
jgi:signal transduction histidine kinase